MSGCDVSNFQGTIDFDLLAQEMSFVISKATEGVGYKDPTFDRNWDKTKAAGLVRGAYHFARPDLGNSGQSEATYFLGHIGPISGDILALDYEVQWDGDVVGWCKEFLDLVRVTGVTPFIYLNRSLVRGYDWTPVIDAGYPLWLADYDGQPDTFPQTPWPTVAMKQWTSSGSVAGVTGRVDLNTWQEEDMADAKAIAEKVLADAGLDPHTVEVIKRKLDGHIHALVPNANQTTGPLFPPVAGALYGGGAADFSEVVWDYPDGTRHTWIDGKEAGV